MDPELDVVGRHALFFDDDASAAFVNSKEALVEWNSLFIDRYDVRHLLSNPPSSFRRLGLAASSPPDADAQLQSQLDLERYADLPSSPSVQPEGETEMEARATAGFHAVPFSYGNLADSEQKNAELAVETSAFHPPFHVPENLLQNLPPTEKLHQIIARTAMFVCKHGGQSEIVLRVKQGDNPTFGFLMPHHNLHPYFRYLVDNPELLMPDNDEKSRDEKNDGNQTGGALSLLGSVYGSGEDEDGVAESAKCSAAAGGLHQSEQAAVVPHKDEVIPKHPHSSKTKANALSKHRITSIRPALPYFTRKDGDVKGSSSNDTDKSKAETSVVDPPSEIKRLVDRIVEIILKNGKDFEAVLVEQDKKHGKFPFLLPSNQYHAYYLKALKKAQESRVGGKGFSSEKGSSSWQELDRRSTSGKETDFSSSGSAANELPLEYDDDRKEKFKMVIGKSKKDSQDVPPKDTQQQPAVRVDAAAAAAILQAATRGIKKPRLDIFSWNGANHNLKDEAGQASSGLLQSSQLENSARKQNEDGKPSSVTVPVAKEIAKTAALVAASEADSSEAGLTREQKLKAERLKRAKMFSAMIKSGVTPLAKEPLRALSVDPPGSGISGSATNPANVNEEPKERQGSSPQAAVGVSVTSGKIESSKKDSSSDNEMEHKSRKRRHYRSRKHDSEGEEDVGKSDTDTAEENEIEEERRHSRKKHRSHHSSRQHRDRSKDRHKHRRKHSSKSKVTRHRRRHDESSSEEEEDYGRQHHHYRHRHKHDGSSSEDEHRSNKRRHNHDSSSEDEQKHRRRRHNKDSQKDKLRRHRKSRDEGKSHMEQVELEEGEIQARSSDQSLSNTCDPSCGEGSMEGSKSSNQEIRTPSLPPPETTEVPDELRAKIRAMLLATM